jgi:excisionase family DNA binding protein
MMPPRKPTYLPIAIPQGDGSSIIRPGKPLDKLTLRQAAKRAGCSRTTIYRLYQAGFLKGDRPSARKIFIFADSLEQHLENCKNPEFWKRGDALKQFKGSV